MTIRVRDLDEIWDQQYEYNQKIKDREHETDTQWMTDYLLGTVSELGELLKEMEWKKHRIHDAEGFGPNVSEELADMTKYVFSMWQLAGFSSQDMLSAVYRKGEILEQLYWQEISRTYKDTKILILDLDGVVADFRAGFSRWVQNSQWSSILQEKDGEFGIHMDLNNEWEYDLYEEAKLEFERLGGYQFLPPIQKVLSAVQQLWRNGFRIFVWTARPNHIYKRIRSDTWSWLMDHDVPATALHFGGDERVRAAKKFSQDNFVVALEDNPTLAKRYAGSKIPVVLINQPYNQEGFNTQKVLRVLDHETDIDIVNLVNVIQNYEEERTHDRSR